MKPAASLTASLLARKGEARSAATPQLVHAQRGGRGPESVLVREGSRPAQKRIALTLRLDKDRHRRLRLLSVHTDRSMQDLLIEMVDEGLDNQAARVLAGACPCLDPAPLNGQAEGEPQ